jgi:hypothetical protein
MSDNPNPNPISMSLTESRVRKRFLGKENTEPKQTTSPLHASSAWNLLQRSLARKPASQKQTLKTSYLTRRRASNELDSWPPPSHTKNYLPSKRKRSGHQPRSIRISNVRLPVPGKVILPRETSPLVRTPLYAAEELVRFGRLVDLRVSLEVFRGDKALAAVYTDATSRAVPASMVAAKA